jgi:hypothetical protein
MRASVATFSLKTATCGGEACRHLSNCGELGTFARRIA